MSGMSPQVVLLGDAEDALPNRQRCPATSRALNARPEVTECVRAGVGEALFSCLKPHTKLWTRLGRRGKGKG